MLVLSMINETKKLQSSLKAFLLVYNSQIIETLLFCIFSSVKPSKTLQNALNLSPAAIQSQNTSQTVSSVSIHPVFGFE
jgi:hypothetical protein